MKQNDANLTKFVRFEVSQINHAVEKALRRYGNNTYYDSNILKLIALYDDREKFSTIRENMRRNKGRIKSGREAPIMRKILRKTVSSQVNKVENVQELRTMTPPSSLMRKRVTLKCRFFRVFLF